MTENDKKELYNNYIKEAVVNLEKQKFYRNAMRDIVESVKETGFNTKEFNAAVRAKFNLSKALEQLELLTVAIEAAERV